MLVWRGQAPKAHAGVGELLRAAGCVWCSAVAGASTERREGTLEARRGRDPQGLDAQHDSAGRLRRRRLCPIAVVSESHGYAQYVIPERPLTGNKPALCSSWRSRAACKASQRPGGRAKLLRTWMTAHPKEAIHTVRVSNGRPLPTTSVSKASGPDRALHSAGASNLRVTAGAG